MGCEGDGEKSRLFVPRSEAELEAALYDATMLSDPNDIRAGNRLDYERSVVGSALVKQGFREFCRGRGCPEDARRIREMVVEYVLSLPAFHPENDDR